jgi:peptide/nickel transport system substrate-binding protein
MVFRYNQAKDITSLDPAFSNYQANMWAVNQLFNGLVQMTDDLEIAPCIATSWEIDESGTVYTFNLRDDVYFHDHEKFPEGKGRRVVAADVVYSFNRIIDPQVASKGAWIFNDRVAKQEPFKAIDDNTVQIKLIKPFQPFLGILTMQYCSIVPEEVVSAYGKDFRTHPVGTGPFKLNQWKEGQYLIMSKNPGYFEKEGTDTLPYLDEVVISFIQDKNMEFIKLLQGDLDLVSGIDGKTVKDDILTRKGELVPAVTDRIKLDRTPYLMTEFIGILVNPDSSGALDLLQIKKIRQAINYAIDKEQMVIFLRNNIGSPARGGFIPGGLPAHDGGRGYTFDREKARLLIAESGVNLANMEPIQLYTTAANLDICTFTQKQLEEIGLPTSIEIVQTGVMLEMTSNSKAPFYRGSWIADYPSEESMLVVFYGPNPAPPNYTRFSNAAFDSLYEAALKELDPARRTVLYAQMDEIVVDEAPVVFLFHDEVLHFKRNHVTNLGINGLNSLNLKRVRIEK